MTWKQCSRRVECPLQTSHDSDFCLISVVSLIFPKLLWNYFETLKLAIYVESEAHIEDKHFDGVHISQLLSFFLAPGICLDTIHNSSFLMAWA